MGHFAISPIGRALSPFVFAATLLLMGGTPSNAQAGDTSRADYAHCVRGAWPTIDDAEIRSASCSRVLQSKSLQPDEIALARLTRGSARYVLGQKIVANDDYRDALEHYDGAINPRNPNALMLIRRGVALGGLGEIDKALADYGQAIRLDPGPTFAYLQRGVLLASSARLYQRAIDDFNRVLELEPKSVVALVARGSAYSQLGRQGEAIIDFNQAIALAPRASEPYYHRGVAHFRRGERSFALGDYDTAIKLNPQNAAALVSRAAIHAEERRFDEAIADLNAALDVDAGNAVAYYNRGYARFAKQEYDKAIADYSVAIALDPAMATAYNNRCLVRGITGKDLVRALGDCDTALKFAPLSLDVRTTRGFVFLKLGDSQLALNEYNAVLERDPNHPIALYGRGLALIANGKADEGRRDQAAAEILDPEVAASFSSLGLK